MCGYLALRSVHEVGLPGPCSLDPALTLMQQHLHGIVATRATLLTALQQLLVHRVLYNLYLMMITSWHIHVYVMYVFKQ